MLNFIWRYLKNYKIKLLMAAVCSVLIAAVNLSEPYLTAKLIDEILVTRDKAYFYIFILFMLVISVLAIASNWYSAVFSSEIRAKLNNLVIEDLLKHLYKTKYDIISQTDMIYMSKRIEEDAVDLVCFIINLIINIAINFALICMALFLINNIAFKWVMIFAAIIFIQIYFYKILGKILLKRSAEMRETGAKYFTALSDMLLYIYSIKLHNLYEKYAAKFNSEFQKHFMAVMRHMKVQFWFMTSSINMNSIFNAIIFLLGGIDVLQGKISIGNFVALNGYFMSAMSGASYFMNVGQEYQNSLAAYNRIIEIKNLELEDNGCIILNKLDSIKVLNLSFSIGGRVIFKNFTQVFKRGKIYCLTGRNGSGKSTLINLICGLPRLYSGEIKYNNILINELDMTYTRQKLIAAVEQKNFLKNDNLSGGERRKLSIKDALLKNAELLIMDEPDNNLDSNGLTELLEDIMNGSENRITIIISHNKLIQSAADEIINLSK